MARGRKWQVLRGVLVAALVARPAPVQAQFAAVEAFLRNATDLSFYGGFSTLLPSSDRVRANHGHLSSFGVELLFEIGSIERARPPAPAPPRDTAARVPPPPPPRDPPGMVLRRVEVRKANGTADTLYVYEPRVPPPPPRDRIWTFEMGIGYGQVVGFDLAAPNFSMKGAVRDLPSASVYISYDPIGLYWGVRTGYMKMQGLQVVQTATGVSADGTGESFFAGALAGYSHEFGGVNVFLEPAYSIRYFPSLQWVGDATVRAVVPRDLQLSGLSITTGIQIALHR